MQKIPTVAEIADLLSNLDPLGNLKADTIHAAAQKVHDTLVADSASIADPSEFLGETVHDRALAWVSARVQALLPTPNEAGSMPTSGEILADLDEMLVLFSRGDYLRFAAPDLKEQETRSGILTMIKGIHLQHGYENNEINKIMEEIKSAILAAEDRHTLFAIGEG